MNVKINDIKALLTTAAVKFVSENEAKYFAELSLDNHIKKSPRINPLRETITDLRLMKQLGKNHKLKIEYPKKAAIKFDFDSMPPVFKIKTVHDEIIKCTKENGVSIAAIVNTGGIHSLNIWTDALGKHDILSIFTYNGGPLGVVPYGGTLGIFGTNPISFSIPSIEKPVIADFATSEIPYWELVKSIKENKSIPLNSAVDKNGEQTTDPHKVIVSEDGNTSNLLSIGGGIKGYLITYLTEVLSSTLVGTKIYADMDPNGYGPDHGGIFISIDISTFTKTDIFKSETERLNSLTRSQKPKHGLDKIRIPGDQSYEKYNLTESTGLIEIDNDIFEELKTLSN